MMTMAITVLYYLPIVFILIPCADQYKLPENSQNKPPQAWNFLENYGYLPKSGENNTYNLLSHQELKKAIVLMQKYANIPQTGVLDKKTLDKMKAPRCALPDVIDADHIHVLKQNRRQKRFVIYGPKWTKSPITWSLVQSSRVVPPQTAIQVFSEAFKLWSTASPKLKFTKTSGKDADIKIGFYVGDHGCGVRQAFDGRGTKLAHAFSPPKGDVHFDDDEDWANEAEGLSLYWTALHEFGHSLGFAHTADESSIMFPYYQDHGKNFVLPDVDKAGVRYLYGDSETKQEEKLPFPNKKPTEEFSTTPKSDEGGNNYPCNTNIDAIASIRGDIFIFKQNVFWWLQSGLHLVRREAIPISQYFDGFPSDIAKVDAVYERKSDQKIMFFVGHQYWLFSANRLYDGPKSLTSLGLPSDLDSIDAITNWGHNGRAYIFSGSIYWKLDETETHVETDYPRDMTVWKGVPLNVDAAFTWEFDSATYFFKGNLFWKFNNNQMKIDYNYPKLIQDFWFKSLQCVPSDRADNYQHGVFNLEARSNSVTIVKYSSIGLSICWAVLLMI